MLPTHDTLQLHTRTHLWRMCIKLHARYVCVCNTIMRGLRRDAVAVAAAKCACVCERVFIVYALACIIESTLELVAAAAAAPAVRVRPRFTRIHTAHTASAHSTRLCHS